MRTRIISAFPGCGKSHFFRENKETTLDSDSSLFSWTYHEDGSKERNPEFPNNYIQHIKENIGKYEFILVSSHKEVRDALLDNCLFFYLVYPERFCDKSKDVYIQRYKERGSPESFIGLVEENWDDWIKELYFCERGCRNSSLPSHWFLSNEIRHIIASENGEC